MKTFFFSFYGRKRHHADCDFIWTTSEIVAKNEKSAREILNQHYTDVCRVMVTVIKHELV